MNTAPAKRRNVIAALIAFAAVAAASAVGLIRSRQQAPEPPAAELKQYSFAFGTMGTRAGCAFYAADERTARAGFAAVTREFDRVTQACNLHDENSELARLNREAGRDFFVCSELLWNVLSEARRAHRASSGAFDVTIKPLMNLWGFYRKRKRAPSPAEIAATLESVGFDKLEWDDARRAVRFKAPGMALDLGGVAKGYALDLAAAAVKKLGIKSGVIDLGGNLYLLPEPPPGKTHYRIGVKSPSGRGDSGTVLELPGNCAVSTSGSYERFVVLDGRRCGHVVDPATGAAPYLNRSATAVAPTGIESDWLSSAAFLRGEKLIPQLEKFVPGAKIFFTDASADTESRRPVTEKSMN